MPIALITETNLIYEYNGYLFEYLIHQQNGQLQVSWVSDIGFGHFPEHGTEIFAKKIPRTIELHALFEYFAQSGPIFELRLLMEFSGLNRGYCFVRYFKKWHARKAVCTLNQTEITKNAKIVVSISLDNARLVLEDVLPNMNFNNISEAYPEFTEGLVHFATSISGCGTKKSIKLTYMTHAGATAIRKKLWPNFQVDGSIIGIDWAVPRTQFNGIAVNFTGVDVSRSKLEIYEAVSGVVDTSGMIRFTKNYNSGSFVFEKASQAMQAFRKLSGLKIGTGVLLVYPPRQIEFHVMGPFNKPKDDENEFGKIAMNTGSTSYEPYKSASETQGKQTEVEFQAFSSNIENPISTMQVSFYHMKISQNVIYKT